MMKKLLIVLSIALSFLSGVVADPVSVTAVNHQVNLLGGVTGMEAFTPGSTTAVTFLPGATTGGFDIQLTGPVLLGKIQVSLRGAANLQWQALKGDQVIDLWSRQEDGLYDISGNGVVADRLRLVVTSADLTQVFVDAIKVFGEDPGAVAHRIIPTEVDASSQSSFFFGPENLWDGNPGSDWMVYQPQDLDDVLSDIRPSVRGAWPGWWRDWTGAYDTRVVATLPAGKRLSSVQIFFGSRATGTLAVEGLFSGQWKPLGNLTAVVSGWGSLTNPYPNEVVSQIRLISYPASSATAQVDLGEVLFWGSGNWVGDDYQKPDTAGIDATGNVFGFYTADPADASTRYFEFVLEGQTTTLPSVEVDGLNLGAVNVYASAGVTNYYRVNVTGKVNAGQNLIWVRGITGTWISGRVHVQKLDGSASWVSSAGILGDGWKYLPVQSGETQYLTPSLQIGGQFQLYGDGYLQTGSDQGGWTEPSSIPTADGKIYLNWPLGPGIKVVAARDGVGELRFSGVSSLPGGPSIQILWPSNGTQLSQGEVHSRFLVGRLSDPGQTIRVNGQAVQTKGSLFWVPLANLGLQKDQMNKVTVTATAQNGAVTTQLVGVGVDLDRFWNPGIGSATVTTDDDTFTLSGQTFVSNVSVFLGESVGQPDKGRFAVTVPLKPGVNSIPVRLVWKPTGAVLDSFTATILSTSQGITLTVQGEGRTTFVSQKQYLVSGTVVSQKRVRLTINNQATSVNGYQFQRTVTLTSGLNTITVLATESNHRVTKVVNVFYEAAKPVLTLTSPTAGVWFSKQLVIAGSISDPAPAYLWANGILYEASSGHFSFSIPVLKEGPFTYQFQAQNQAGTMGDVQSVTFKMDNTNPATFPITANVTGWTSNNTPTLGFSTTDAVSGVNHYEYSINQGAWATAVSPLTLPTLADGVDTVRIKAVDNAGNVTTQAIDLSIDTVAPLKVINLRAVPGNGMMDVLWGTRDNDVIAYHVTRTPAWAEGERVVAVPELTETGLTAGDVYTYTVWPEDHAHNGGPSATTTQSITGLSVTPIIADSAEPLVVEYDNLKAIIPAGSLPEGNVAVLVKEITSATMSDASSYPIVSPIYSITTLARASDGSLQETGHSEFSKEVLMVLDYDVTQLPNGFPETNLGVYYFDTTWSKWFKIEKSSVDTTLHKIIFTTNHFTDFSVQPTMISDLSPQQLKDIGHSPNKTESSAGAVTVSPQGGTAMTEVTDFVLPGRNGFSLPIKRMYDTGTALTDSPSLSLSASLSFNDFGSLLDLANIGAQLVTQGVSGMVGAIKGKVSNILKQNGDYALAAGVGWRLNLPYVMTTNTSIAVRLPNGGYYNVNQMHSNNDFWASNPVSRTLDFENHEGADFHFRVTQVRGNGSDALGGMTGLLSSEASHAITNSLALTGGPNGPPSTSQIISLVASMIPGWSTIASELWTKDGTYYLFDTRGRIVRMRDKTGLNTYQFHYDGLLLHDISDDLGRQVLFEYNNPSVGAAFARPVITKIWTSGYVNHGTGPAPVSGTTRTVTLNYDWSAGSSLGTFFNFLPTLNSSSDPLGRQFSYSYRQLSIVTGGGAVKINFLAILLDFIPGVGPAVSNALGIAALTLSGNIEINLPYVISRVVAPGIGITDIAVGAHDLSQFDFRPTDYFLGLFPTALQVSYQILFRLNTDWVRVTSSAGVVRTTNYSYNWASQQTLNGTQYFVDKTTVDDGRTKVIHLFSAHSVWRNRFISWDDWLVASAQSLFQSELYTVPEIYSLESGSTTYDQTRGGIQIESVQNSWDLGTHRLLSAVTSRGHLTTSTVSYQYDNWGNQTYVLKQSSSNGLEQKSEQWNWYLNTGSTPPAHWPVTHLFEADETLVEANTRDLLKGSLIRAYRPDVAGGGYQDIAREAAYNALGLKKSDGLWTGTHWAVTSFTYYRDANLLSAGSIESQIGPLPGQATNWTYDYARPAKDFYTVTQTTHNVVDPAGNAVDLVQETAYDWNTGWKLYDKDALGHVTEYAYDPLHRQTDSVKVGDEATLSPGTWSVVHTNAPWEHIVYDDNALTATVYRSNYTSSITNTLGGLLEKYTYDDLGQLVAIEKYNSHDWINGTLTAISPTQISRTLATYTPWGEVASMTDPNNNQTGYAYDALGQLVRTTHADGTASTVVYDYSQNLKTATNERGVQTREWFTWSDQPLVKVEDVGEWNILTQSFYDGSSQLVAQTDALNQTTITVYGPFGKPTDIKRPSVEIWQSPSQRASSASFPASTTLVVPEDAFTYDDAGQLIQQQTGYDGTWRQTLQEYDTAGRLIKKTIGVAGGAQRQEWNWYDANGNLIKHADPLVVTQIQAGTTDANGAVGFNLKTYSNRNKLLTETDPSGAIVRYQYDSLDRKVQMKDPRASISGLDNFTIRYGYNDLDRLVFADLPAVAGQSRSSHTFAYDLRGNALTQTDPSGRVTRWSYDNRNRKIGQSVTGADGTGPLVSAWAYDEVGNSTKETIGGTLVTNKVYDGMNRLTETQLPDGQKQKNTYDQLGRTVAVTDAVGNTTYQTYNSLNKVTVSEDPARNKTLFVYNVWSDTTATKVQNSVNGDQVWVRYFNAFSQVEYEHNNAGQFWSYRYDPRGLVVGATDPNGTTTTNTYSATGLLTNRSMVNSTRSLNESFSYDVAGSLMGAVDGGVATKINQAGGSFNADPYDLVNSYSTTLSTSSGPKSLNVGYVYDNAHQPTKLTYPDGTSVTYQYNGLEQLISIPGYASNGLYNSLGRLNSLSAPNGTQRTKTWDATTGTLNGYSWGVDGKTDRTLGWDNRGNLANQTKDNFTSAYHYDELNRLTSADEGGKFEALTDDSMPMGSQSADVAGAKSLNFSHPNEIVKLDYYSTSIGVDLTQAQSISKMRLLGTGPRFQPDTIEVYLSQEGTRNSWTKLTDTTWLQDETGVTLQFATPHQGRFIKIHSTWDERGQRNKPVDVHTLDGAAGQLLQVWYFVDGQTTSWTYDSLGNRVVEYRTRGNTTQNDYSYYPFSNRIKTSGSWSFNYDGNGNLTSRGTSGSWNGTDFDWNTTAGELWQYGYDLKNRLISVKHGVKGSGSLKNTVTYRYDIRDLRVETVKSSGTAYTQYDQSGDLLWTEDGTTTKKYIQALGQTWAEVRTTGGVTSTYWHSTDHEGSTNVITDASGAIVWDGDYEAFGSVARSNGTLGFDASYTGKQFDKDTGLYYYNARFYDPTLGRFISEDPARDGSNWSIYVYDNPLRFVDPTGLKGGGPGENTSKLYSNDPLQQFGFGVMKGISAWGMTKVGRDILPTIGSSNSAMESLGMALGQFAPGFGEGMGSMGGLSRRPIGPLASEMASVEAKVAGAAETPAATLAKGQVKAGEVTTYQDFKDRSVVGDDLEGHELWQHANINEQGLATTRLSTDASKLNPVIALDKDTHKLVNEAQRGLDARSMSPADNIAANATILKQVGNVPESTVNAMSASALEHASRFTKKD